MGWEVELHVAVEEWFMQLAEEDPETADLIGKALDHLEAEGPRLGRPLVDRVKGSEFHKMKELRPASGGRTEVRMLFAFDPNRRAFFLVAGDKANDWRGWYATNIPLADKRFEDHLAQLDRKG